MKSIMNCFIFILFFCGIQVWADDIFERNEQYLSNRIRIAAQLALLDSTHSTEKADLQMAIADPSPRAWLFRNISNYSGTLVIRHLQISDIRLFTEVYSNWPKKFILKSKKIDSNFSSTFLEYSKGISKLSLISISKINNHEEWQQVSYDVARNLALLKYIAKLPKEKWVSARGEPTANPGLGAGVSFLGIVESRPDLILTGALIAGFNGPVHKLVPDLDMERRTKALYFSADTDISTSLGQKAELLGVGSITEFKALFANRYEFFKLLVSQNINRTCSLIMSP